MANNRNTLIAVVAIVALVAIGLVLYFALHKSNHKGGKNGTKVSFVRPIGFTTVKNLKQEAAFLHTNFFWAGPQPGTIYEYQRTVTNHQFVRYLTSTKQVGTRSGNFLTIATYNLPGAYSSLKKKAKLRGFSGPAGSIVYVDPQHRTNVYMAFPGIDQEVEIFDKSPAVALATARSGNIQLVR